MADSPQNNPPKVFISYAWKNQAVAKRLQSDLQRDGVEVFVDYQQMLPGQSLPKRISDALKWCNTLVLLWSAGSEQSYWVTLEWENAIALRKQIIPCLLDNTELPAVLTRTLFLDFSNYESGYAELCRTLGVRPLTPGPEKENTWRVHGLTKLDSASDELSNVTEKVGKSKVHGNGQNTDCVVCQAPHGRKIRSDYSRCHCSHLFHAESIQNECSASSNFLAQHANGQPLDGSSENYACAA